MLGGPSQPAIGFAIGFDRLYEIMAQQGTPTDSGLDVFIISLGETQNKMAAEWTCTLNGEGIRADMDYGQRSLKSLMKRADKLNAAYVVIADETTPDTGQVILRDMSTKDQSPIPATEIVAHLKLRITNQRSK